MSEDQTIHKFQLFSLVTESMQAQSGDSQPIYLYRVHTYDGDDTPTFDAGINTPFDLTFKRTFSIDDFTEFLNEHLKKTQVAADTCLISTSPVITWTVHLTGQKDRRGRVGLAIFDLRRWRRITTSTAFRVRDVFNFLDMHGKAKILSGDVRKWAINCGEYVLIGNIPQGVLVGWVSWEDLFNPSVGLLTHSFRWSYTLGVFSGDFPLVSNTSDVVCSKVVAFARVLAGSQDELVAPFIKSILEDGIEVWGYVTPISRIEIERTACALVELGDLEGISSLSTS